MSLQNSIQILSSQQIDKQKWNACLHAANNTIIYAYFDYLQLITDSWAGIVVNDYKAVMPLPFRRKLGIRYAYDVPFIQQLGLFGNYDDKLLKEVITVAIKYIQYGDFFFNSENNVTSVLPNVRCAENYVLSLSSSYKNIYKNYNKHLQTKLKKWSKNKLSFKISDDVEGSVLLFQNIYSHRLPQIKKKNFQQLKTLAVYLLLSQQCFVGNVYKEETDLVASALFFKDDNRIYNILPSTTTEGRKVNAMHFLLDNIIQQHAESRMILDFEGSDVPGIKAFYQSFGATNQPYFHYHFNHLPFPLQLLKR